MTPVELACIAAAVVMLLLMAAGALILAYGQDGESVKAKIEQERFRALVKATAQIVWTFIGRGWFRPSRRDGPEGRRPANAP